MQAFSEKREELKKFFYEIKDCRNCKLGETRINFVFGSGSADSKIMFIGEAPGRNEDLQGKPFVGQAGKILDELLSILGFERKDIFIANVLKCRPPQNRDPQSVEINNCKNYLFRQIQIINPPIICTLGRHSTQLILKTDKNITGLRGRIFKIDNRYIMPINHPAAVLYTPSRMEVLKNDFLKLKELIRIADGEKPESSLFIESSPEAAKTLSPATELEEKKNKSLSEESLDKENPQGEIKDLDKNKPENISLEQMGLF
ncbi:MAG: uracil-DNA glycosylase [Actinomycetota bacterium]|nr:uracil-DNA glycosylase [Actinomycetota bacterium]